MSLSLEDLRPQFYRHLRVEGKAPRTQALYGQSLTYFSRYLDSRDIAAELSALTRDNVLDWLADLRERGQSAATIQTRWRGLRRFINWAMAEDILDTDPLAGITVSKPEPPPVPVLTDEDLAALILACRGKGFINRRDEVVIRLLMDCGLRVSELCGIDLDDIDLNNATVSVTGKGSRVRAAYFGDKTGQAIDRYMRERATHRRKNDPALLLGERGRFTPDGVRERLKIRADMAGLDPATVHPHRFRHTNAHDFLLSGGQERDLKRLMGWRTDTMLERYGASAADYRAREAARKLKRGDRV